MMELIGVQSKNPGFSMRAYSKKLGIPQSAISEIISRKRKVTLKMAGKILKGLDFSPDKSAQLVGQFDPHSKVTPIKSEDFHALDMDTFHLISEWYPFGI